ncbi:MAG: hypothetical protein ND807_13915 [Vicinamibacterales bacterium]|nr:hypothetical protein [Vicinamibacterales bacterium]
MNSLGCGKKGPPLPPIVYAPSPAGEFTAKRSGEDIVLHFKVPTANTNGISPADLERLDVYAHTGPLPSPADYLKFGTLIGTLAVKAPPDPKETSQSGKREEGKGKGGTEPALEQGMATSVREAMTPALLEPGALPYVRPVGPVAGPTLPEVVETPGTVNLPPPVMRYYVVVGTSRKNKKGAFAGPLGVPMSATVPGAPDTPSAAYTQDSLSLTWSLTEGGPRRFNVYEVSATPDVAPAARVGGPPVLPANAAVLAEPSFTDKVQFGTEKCYVVRNVLMVGAVALESEPSAPVCVTARDTFAPSAPKALVAVSDDKGVNLIWEANTEPDLGGYLVMRQQAGGDFVQLTAEAIKDTSYRDAGAESGGSYAYAVVAVDTAMPANKSELSNRVEVVR